MGESGKDFSSSSLITWPTIWKGLTGLFTGGGGGARDKIGCSGSTLCLAIALLASTGGMICHLPPSLNSWFELLSNSEVWKDLGDSTLIWKIGEGVTTGWVGISGKPKSSSGVFNIGLTVVCLVVVVLAGTAVIAVVVLSVVLSVVIVVLFVVVVFVVVVLAVDVLFVVVVVLAVVLLVVVVVAVPWIKKFKLFIKGFTRMYV